MIFDAFLVEKVQNRESKWFKTANQSGSKHRKWLIYLIKFKIKSIAPIMMYPFSSLIAGLFLLMTKTF